LVERPQRTADARYPLFAQSGTRLGGRVNNVVFSFLVFGANVTGPQWLEKTLNDIAECREMEFRCLQRARAEPENSWKWLGQAERWRELAHSRVAHQISEAHCPAADDGGANADGSRPDNWQTASTVELRSWRFYSAQAEAVRGLPSFWIGNKLPISGKFFPFPERFLNEMKSRNLRTGAIDHSRSQSSQSTGP
jgi:hypothetical protein